MVINGSDLLNAAPIKDMIGTKEKKHGVSHGCGEAGYDIRIKQEVRFYGNFRGDRGVEVVEFDSEGKTVSWKQNDGRFALASAIEEFQMPTQMMGIVHDKSTWARQGLSVFNTVIEPGWNGFLTLELVYHGNETLVIPAGAGIAQVIFHQVIEHARYEGKYQGQANEPVSAITSV